MSLALRTALQRAARCLQRRQVDEPLADAEVLLADVLTLPRLNLYIDAHRPLSDAQHHAYLAHLCRRMQGEPVQYITGKQEFRSLSFEVNPQVLIPRPESELLVEHGVRWARQWAKRHGESDLRCLDVGAGSGNLGVSLLHELPECRVGAIDSSLAALKVARRNARQLGVADRWFGLCGDLLEPLLPDPSGFAVCVANLPYVTAAEWQALPPHVKDHEPVTALLGGTDGLDVIRRLIATAPDVLASQGVLLLEVGWQQASAAQALAQQTARFEATGVHRDFAGIERVVWARMP
jgi:release factor glutamine methyltransferase